MPGRGRPVAGNSDQIRFPTGFQFGLDPGRGQLAPSGPVHGLVQSLADAGAGSRGGLGRRAGVVDPVEPAAGGASPRGEIEEAVGTDVQVGHVQGFPRDEVLAGGGVGGSGLLRKADPDASPGPVSQKKGTVIFPGVGPVQVEGDSHRRAASQALDGGERIGVVAGELAGSRPPPVVSSGNRVKDPDGPVPGESEVPLHVRIEGEEFPLRVQGEVEGVPESGAELGPLVIGQIQPMDGARRHPDRIGVAPRIQVTLQQVVFLKSPGRGPGVDGHVGVGVVSVEQVEVAVHSGQDGVRSMFSDSSPAGGDQGGGVGLVVAIFVDQPVESGSFGAVGLNQQVSGAQVVHPVRSLDPVREVPDSFEPAVCILIRQNVDAPVLAGHDRPAPVVEGQVDQ